MYRNMPGPFIRWTPGDARIRSHCTATSICISPIWYL